MSASAHCHHPGLTYSIETDLAEETGGVSYASVRAAHCPHCNRRWRWVGVEPGFNELAPSVNRNATAVLLPMVEVER